MFTTGQKFIRNNAHSMEIKRKLYGNGNEGHTPPKKAKILNEKNQELIAGQPKLFPDPMTMFHQLPYNDSIVEKTLIHIKAREDANSDTFTFTRPSVTSNLWKLQDTYLSAKISLRVGNANNKLSARIIYLDR